MVESAGRGSDLEMLEYTKNLGEEISEDYVYGVYYYFSIDFTITPEMSDFELKMLARDSGAYNFWDAPEEDIYSTDDGESV